MEYRRIIDLEGLSKPEKSRATCAMSVRTSASTNGDEVGSAASGMLSAIVRLEEPSAERRIMNLEGFRRPEKSRAKCAMSVRSSGPAICGRGMLSAMEILEEAIVDCAKVVAGENA